MCCMKNSSGSGKSVASKHGFVLTSPVAHFLSRLGLGDSLLRTSARLWQKGFVHVYDEYA